MSSRRAAAAITSMNAFVLVLLESGVVGVGVPDAVRADALHDTPVVTPVLRPCAHVVLRATVERTGARALLRLILTTDGCLVRNDPPAAFKQLLGVVRLYAQATPVADVVTRFTVAADHRRRVH